MVRLAAACLLVASMALAAENSATPVAPESPAKGPTFDSTVLGAGTRPASNQSPLTDARAILSLLPDEATNGLPVNLTGQIVFSDPDNLEWFLKTDTAGIRLVRPHGGAPLPLGSVVTVVGVTGMRGFDVVVVERTSQILSSSPLPEAPLVSVDQMVDVASDFQWVDFEAVVEAVLRNGTNRLELVLSGARDTRAFIPAYPGATPPPTGWVDARLRMRGVWTTSVDTRGRFEQNELYLPGTNFVRFVRRAPLTDDELPRQPLVKAYRFNAHTGESRRIKVKGVVTATRGGSMFYVQEGSSGVRVHTRERPRPSPGDEVEVIGFPAVDETTPQIEESVVRLIGRGREVTPVTVDPATQDLDSATFEAVLVQFEAETVGTISRGDGAEIVVRTGGRYFSVGISGSDNVEALRPIRPFSRVRVTGVCVTMPGNNSYAVPIRLILRSSDDILLLQREPWWTIPKAVVIFVLVVSLLLYWRIRAWREQLRLETSYRKIFENASELICVHSGDGAFLDPNPAWERLTGFTRTELQASSILALVSRDDRASFKTWWESILGERTKAEHQCGLTTKHGAMVRVELRANLMRDATGQAQIETIGSDLSSRWRAERQRRELAAIVQFSDDAIIGKTTDGIITSWNKGAERIFGYLCTEAIGRPMLMLFPPGREKEESDILAMIARGEVVDHFETDRIRKDGRTIRIAATISPLKDEQGRIIGASKIARDITRERQLEEQLRQSQKMEAVGMLAGGVAHDFNNILSSMLLQTNVACFHKYLPEEISAAFDQIRADAQRAANLTRQLLLFSRRQAMLPKVLDLNGVVRQIAPMLHRLIREDIRLRFELSPAPLLTYADPGMLEQVIMNLTVNARDAMPTAGEIIIETATMTLTEGAACADPEAKPGVYVGLRVSDTGTGIPPEVLPRIFDPFFTTKEKGHGTGLGLATVFGIVKQHQGWVSAGNCQGSGAVFRVYLPATTRAPEHPPTQETTLPPSKGNETIFVVEDEDSLRKSACMVLERHGYKVIQAPHGKEALRLFHQRTTATDLLLTDLVMPEGVSGQEVARQMRLLQPGLRVVFMSGYSLDTAGKQLSMASGKGFLQKPFEIGELLKIVRQTLDQPVATP